MVAEAMGAAAMAEAMAEALATGKDRDVRPKA